MSWPPKDDIRNLSDVESRWRAAKRKVLEALSQGLWKAGRETIQEAFDLGYEIGKKDERSRCARLAREEEKRWDPVDDVKANVASQIAIFIENGEKPD